MGITETVLKWVLPVWYHACYDHIKQATLQIKLTITTIYQHMSLQDTLSKKTLKDILTSAKISYNICLGQELRQSYTDSNIIKLHLTVA